MQATTREVLIRVALTVIALFGSANVMRAQNFDADLAKARDEMLLPQG